MKLAHPDRFFAHVRKLTGSLNNVQVSTINGLLTSASHWPIGHVAYGLSTGWGECRLQPIDEIGKGRGRRYGSAGARSNGKAGPLYGGQIPYGRGLVQLTWCDNYEWADAECARVGLIKKGDILKNFDLVKRPDIAAHILVRGMETGAFTGKKLSHYIKDRGTPATFLPCRRIINGTDKAASFSNWAEHFQTGLDLGVWK